MTISHLSAPPGQEQVSPVGSQFRLTPQLAFVFADFASSSDFAQAEKSQLHDHLSILSSLPHPATANTPATNHNPATTFRIFIEPLVALR